MAGAARPLNDKQKAFAREYLIDLNASAAAIRAGYAPKAAGQHAFKLLKNAQIQAEIDKARKRVEAKLDISIERVLAEYASIAFVGMSRFVSIDSDGVPRIDLSKCSPKDIDLLAEVQTDTIKSGAEGAPPVERVKIKMLDRMNALEKLARHLGAFKAGEQSPLEDALTLLLKNAQGTAMPLSQQSQATAEDDE